MPKCKTELDMAINAYTKEQILTSSKYTNRVDLLRAILIESKKYTIDQVDCEIEKFMKRKV